MSLYSADQLILPRIERCHNSVPRLLGRHLHADVTDDVLTDGRLEQRREHLERVQNRVALEEVVVTPVTAENASAAKMNICSFNSILTPLFSVLGWSLKETQPPSPFLDMT